MWKKPGDVGIMDLNESINFMMGNGKYSADSFTGTAARNF